MLDDLIAMNDGIGLKEALYYRRKVMSVAYLVHSCKHEFDCYNRLFVMVFHF